MLYVGIDVGKERLEVATWVAGASRGRQLGSVANRQGGWRQLGKQLRRICKREKLAEVQLLLEPTGGYELGLVAYGHAQGWRVTVVNPSQVRNWARGIGNRVKTDREDALLLARYGAEQQPAPQQPVPAEVQALDSLLSRREDLKKLLRAERNRLDTLQQRPGVPAAVKTSVERTIAMLQQEAEAIEEAIQDHIDQDPDLQDKVRRLRSVPGIGPRNVLPLLLLFLRWELLTGGQGDAKGLTAYVGLDPQPYESGRSVLRRATISRMGNGMFRHQLFLAALGGVRGQNPLRAFYQRLVERGKVKKLALVAAARKVLVWGWTIFINNTQFDASLHQQEAPQAAITY